MNAAYVVLLIGVALAVVAIAGYLIAITLILKHVVNRLVSILAAVDAVTETTQPVGAVVNDLNSDLNAGRQLIEGLVERLESSRAPVGAAAPTSRHGGNGDGQGTAGEWEEETSQDTPTADPAAAPEREPLPRERHPPERSPWDEWDRSATAAPPPSDQQPDEGERQEGRRGGLWGRLGG